MNKFSNTITYFAGFTSTILIALFGAFPNTIFGILMFRGGIFFGVITGIFILYNDKWNNKKNNTPKQNKTNKYDKNTSIHLFNPPEIKIEKIQEQILQLLFNNNGLIIDELSNTLKIKNQLVIFHLTELNNINFVNSPVGYSPREEWSISQEGRRYLVKNNLIT